MACRRGAGAIGWFAVVAIALSGCSQFDVRTRQDPNVAFGGLRTYAWLPPNEAEPADQRVNDRAVDRRIRAATDEELRAKGYQPTNAQPDFFLNYRLRTSPGDPVAGGRRGYAGALWGEWPVANEAYDSHDVGTLFVAVLDGETKDMIWVGAAHGRLLPHVSLERRMGRVDDAVHAIFAPFPDHR